MNNQRRDLENLENIERKQICFRKKKTKKNSTFH